jgi:hypothetical protein
MLSKFGRHTNVYSGRKSLSTPGKIICPETEKRPMLFTGHRKKSANLLSYNHLRRTQAVFTCPGTA